MVVATVKVIFVSTTITDMRLVYVQTVLTEEELKKLFEKTGETNKKDAVRKAVLHYLKCNYDVEE